ncbi:CaiB/BaiF CoA transferase family protein [Microbacterium aerolatum]|uniref:CoA transferase n=1 Tax=Microbacterium aerolatum TaxID=153731 RepID=A0A511AE68_9MICO|nr:CoA transferase [Microbacterium aerolatum]GEK86419.1 CoA transferase [Microbacterium aerolatum]GGB22708.1 CoA transferase [Microbacterium aerolatum]
MQSPLKGIRVLDLSRAVAGPLCSSLLSDLGADVFKVEGAPHGDPARAWGPFDDDVSLYFSSVNRGKSSIALDFRAPGSIDLIRELIAQVDVLIENFRPGVMAEMGLDPEELRREHPQLIISSVSGYGSIGPERSTPGLDQVAQGMSGLMSVTGPDKKSFYRLGVPIVDELAGMFSALGIVASLVGRERGGEGSQVQTSLLEAGISAMIFQAQQYLSLGTVPEPQGNHHPVISPYGAFKAADMPLTIAVGTAKHWVLFCEMLGEPDLATREEYATGALRSANGIALRADIERLLGAQTASHWLSRLREMGIPSGPIYTVDQTFADPQVQALEMVQHVADDQGRTVPVLRGPLWIDGVATEVRSAAPGLGSQGEAVLREFGIAQERIDAFIGSGVLHVRPRQETT